MTKKKAMKQIMAFGIQRNEAQRLLQIEHENGKTNFDAVWNIVNADRFFDKIAEAAQAFGVSLQTMVDSLNEITRGLFHENPGD